MHLRPHRRPLGPVRPVPPLAVHRSTDHRVPNPGWEGILGFIFLPYTTLFYALVYAPVKGVDAFGWFIVACGVLLMSVHISLELKAERRRRRRLQQAS